jgi:hypothetical protein
LQYTPYDARSTRHKHSIYYNQVNIETVHNSYHIITPTEKLVFFHTYKKATNIRITNKMSTFHAIALTALALLPSLPSTSAHSWVEEFQIIGPNGTYIGDRGYSRGYMARTDPGYNGFSMDYLVPQTGVRITANDSLCHPSQQSSNYSNPAYPMLQATPGSYVAMKYLENGHVTLPWNQLGKPAGAGTVFVYGTTTPSKDEKIVDVLEWTSDGSGGNGKGFLMAAQNFDDGRCHQINCGNISIDRQTLFPAHVEGQPTSSVEQWCETDLHIPDDTPIGKLAVYWVWQWPTEPGHDCTLPEGKDEYYTTCSDFEIIANTGANADAAISAEVVTTNTLAQENSQSTAVPTYKSRGAFTSSPPIIMMSGTQTVGQTVTAASSFLSACSATGNIAAKVDVPASCDVVSVFTGVAVASAAAAVKQYATTASFVTMMQAGTADASAAASLTESSVTTSNMLNASPTTMTVTEYITVGTVSSIPTSSSTAFATESSASATRSVSSSTIPAIAMTGSSVAYAAGPNTIAYPTIARYQSGPAASDAAFATSTTPTTPMETTQLADVASSAAASEAAEDVVIGDSDRVASERLHARHFKR